MSEPVFTALSEIRWPKKPGEMSQPEWIGTGFRVGEEVVPYLEGPLGETGWSDELAELLLAETSQDRPIGMASRHFAITSLDAGGALGPGKVVMDIGCASGHTLESIREYSPQTALVGSDYALEPLRQLGARQPGIPLLQLDLVNSHLPDAIFDGITLLNVLEHIEDDLGALRQVRRMLKPGGTFVIEVPSGPGLFDPFDKLLGHFRRYRMGELLDKLHSTGFRPVTRSHLGFFAYPAFWLLKKRNQALPKDDEELHRRAVLRTIRSGRPGILPRMVFGLETTLRPFVPMPFGIRCLVSAQVNDR